MAIYHCSIKTVSRSAGRTATAAAAYRASDKIIDERTGEVHDYTKKSGVVHTEILSPLGTELNRAELWNAAEKAENRKNSTVAREYEVALPEELNENQRKELAQKFAQHLVNTYGVVADVAIHEPHRKGDDRNYHAHILTTTRKLTPDGSFGEKTRILDEKKSGEVERIRETWADLANQALSRAGKSERVSHRTLEAQGIDRTPSIHLGPAATAMERRGIESDKGNKNRAAAVKSEQTKLINTEIDDAWQKQHDWYLARELEKKKALEKAQKLEAERVEAEKREAEKQAEIEKKEKAEQRKSRSRGGLGR